MNEKAEKLKRVVESDPDSFIFASIDGDRVSTVLDLDAKMARHNYLNSMAALILAIDDHGPMSAEEIIYRLANTVEENRDSPSIAAGRHDD